MDVTEKIDMPELTASVTDLEKQEFQYEVELDEADEISDNTKHIFSQDKKKKQLRKRPWTPITWHITIALLVIYIISLLVFIKFVYPTMLLGSVKETVSAGHVTLFENLGMATLDDTSVSGSLV
ncbi:hypothetical protein KDRO_D04710 [Kluyveromyces lactis]|nr:hypothetical protein KDRO_D04710 [Kluyveromyces lactis]